MKPIPAVQEYSWGIRLLLAAVAFGGSTVYALSFAHQPAAEYRLAMAKAVGLAAGISWILFGSVVLITTRCRPSMLAWADACLVTMAVGIAVKMVTVAANGMGSPSMSFHGSVLLAANLAMAVVFMLRARSLGMNPWLALVLWFVVLDGLFVGLMSILARVG